MNKTVKSLVLVFATFSFVACDGGGNTENGPIPVSSTTYELVNGEAPSGGYCIYLDASKSLHGYFTKGLTDYIKIISGLQGGNDNTKVYFWEDKKDERENKEIKDLNSAITNGNYTGCASLFQKIFKVMAEKSKKDKTLTFLVTDGVVSNTNSVTQQRTGYTQSDLPLVPGNIKSAIGDSMAVAVFRFQIPFDGTYYDIDNNEKNINAKRPIFVFAIGYPAAVADLRTAVKSKKKEMENFTSLDPTQLYMGIYNKLENKHPFRDIEGFFITDKENSKVELENGVDYFELAVNVPTWIADMGMSPEKGVITIVNSDGSEINVNKHYNNGVMTFSTKEDSKFNIGDYSVDYCINYRVSTTWNQYTCDDDRAIRSDTLCDKTFGLKEILKGFELATNQPDTLFKSSFKFTKN